MPKLLNCELFINTKLWRHAGGGWVAWPLYAAPVTLLYINFYQHFSMFEISASLEPIMKL